MDESKLYEAVGRLYVELLSASTIVQTQNENIQRLQEEIKRLQDSQMSVSVGEPELSKMQMPQATPKQTSVIENITS